jgi:hypothetical protein
MQLSARRLYDYRDQTRPELLLLRASHHEWLRFKRLRRKNSLSAHEQTAISAALESLWAAKRAVREEIKLKRAERVKAWREKAVG